MEAYCRGSEAAERSIGMLECGPAAGVIGSRALGQLLEQSDIIATDMGGTTFKVSVIQNGEIEYAARADGGSLSLRPAEDRGDIDRSRRRLDRFIGAGQQGAARRAALGRLAPRPRMLWIGGAEPTLTDVFMLIGYMDPDIFLGGAMKLDREAARRAFDTAIAQPLGMSVEEAAFGVYRVACAQIADLIHEITVERGLDPRDFVMHAFGGSCGMVAGVFGSELNVKRIVVPIQPP